MRPSRPVVILQAPWQGSIRWLLLQGPVEIVTATRLADVRPALELLDKAVSKGLFAAGFVSYEAAPAFDPALRVRPAGDFPLAWFGLFVSADPVAPPAPTRSADIFSLDWRPSVAPAAHSQAVEAIRDCIVRGDTYQVNYTLRLQAAWKGNPLRLFGALCHAQRSTCCAYVDTGKWVVCSASPELFFQLDGERIWSRPMKGTAPRGRWLEEDEQQQEWLSHSAKNRAENLMIVDMVRNDLGRIARPESVSVARLWEVETYPSVHQMTSTVEARTTASLTEIFSALFPCASVTGAPKVRAMEIITELEDCQRGVYTGAIGLIAPGRQARFNVAIRTVQIDTESCRAEYGTGSGIVWDSAPDEEWQECSTKALVLRAPEEEFQLLETMLWEPGQGFYLLKRHLDRLARSARYFEFELDLATVRRELVSLPTRLKQEPHRIRLLVDASGHISLESSPLPAIAQPWRVALAARAVDRRSRFLFHKTTQRRLYEQLRGDMPHLDDVLLWNEDHEVTESTVANLVVQIDGHLLTPPIDCGLLPGTMRAELLERGEITEARISIVELGRAEQFFLVNSLRGWIRAELDQADLADQSLARVSSPAQAPV